MAKNEKGEATSQQVEITDIPEPQGDKPQIVKHFRSLVSIILLIILEYTNDLQKVVKIQVFSSYIKLTFNY